MNIISIVRFVFNSVLYMSFIGSIAALVILGIRLIVKDKLGIKFQYALDFILILRLLIFFEIHSNMSVYNYTPSYRDTMMNIQNIIENMANVESSTAEIVQEQLTFKQNLICNFINVSAVIWILGILIISVFMISAVLRINYRIKKSNIIYDEEFINIFEKCKRKAEVKRKIKLIRTNVIKSPCVYGVISPKILIPESLLCCKRQIDFEYIFQHELMHIKKHHILINYIIANLSIIYWFNPFIAYSLYRIKDDMEIMCDFEVLSILDEDENINYGNCLLDLQEESIRAPWLPQMAGIINNKNKLKGRIEMIKKFKKSTYKRLSIAALAGIVAIGGGVLTVANASDKTMEQKQIIEDKLDYDFINDKEVVGKWEAVDFVKNESDFNPEKKSWDGELYLKDLIFLNDGKMAQPIADGICSDEVTPVEWLSWTKGIVMHKGDKTASSYKIKEINGEKYMIYQWKNGDYIFRGETPWYYVLKQVQ